MPKGIPNARSVETRADEVRRERRMKPGSLSANGIKLGFDESKFDRKQVQLRWVREERVQQLYAQDWDLVSEKDAKKDTTSLGTIPEANGGVDEAGKPYKMVLMKKFKDWYDADQGKKMEKLNKIDEQIRRGKNTDPDAAKLGATYTPNGANTIESV
ncbi:MAG: hypothetical protein JWM16_6342 [Verrucomicrobiales bacterium]|nr:hypothetical protein [Verrucomicrobiales bacterium]